MQLYERQQNAQILDPSHKKASRLTIVDLSF